MLSGVSYIAPPIDETIRSLMFKHGTVVTLKKGEVVLNSKPMTHFIYVKSGLLAKCCATALPGKSACMELILQGRVASFVTFPTDTVILLNIHAMTKSEVVLTDYNFFRELAAKDIDISNKLMKMYAYCTEATIRGYLSNFVYPAKIRFVHFVESLLLAYDSDFEQEWIPLPVKLTRECFSKLIFTTVLTINKIFAELGSKNYYKREHGRYYFNKELFKSDFYVDYSYASHEGIRKPIEY